MITIPKPNKEFLFEEAMMLFERCWRRRKKRLGKYNHRWIQDFEKRGGADGVGVVTNMLGG